MRFSPAAYVVLLFGGVRPVARAAGCSPSTVSRWFTRSKSNETFYRVPAAYQGILLDAARELGLDLTAEDLINGRRYSSRG